MSQDFDINTFKATYFDECQELLQSGEEDLFALKSALDETGEIDVETLHSVFRAIHSIKGGAGAFNFSSLVDFSHKFENLLDLIRDEKILLTSDLIDVLLLGLDMVEKLVESAQNEEELPEIEWVSLAERLQNIAKGREVFGPDVGQSQPTETPIEEATQKNDTAETVKEDKFETSNWVTYDVTPEQEEEQGWGLYVSEAELNELINSVSTDGEPVDTDPEIETEKTEEEAVFIQENQPFIDLEQTPETTQEENEDDLGLTHYRISFEPDLHLLKFANEPLLLARELATFGEMVVQVKDDKLPSIEIMRSDEAYFSWVFDLKTERIREEIMEVFEFVIDDCKLTVEEMEKGQWPVIENEEDLVDFEQSSQKEDAPAQAELPNPAPDLVSEPIKLDAPVVQETSLKETPKQDIPARPTAALQPKTEPGIKKETVSDPTRVSSIRVELDRVDKLVNMVGELVITQAMLKEQAEQLGAQKNKQITERFDELNAHTRELQAGVMAIRMQPVKTVFARMPRLVRDLSTKLNKKVDVIFSGEMTEVDKTVIEQLMDPLTHMIRNALDHGIEEPARRLQAGKSEKAQIQLSAEHRSGRIHIEISDDGDGINRELVYKKALEKGLITQEDHLSDQEIDELIFAPGFSTAQAVSDVSGRGVGMDVVSSNLSNLGGRIGVFSTPGKGTTFVLSLPLTLAVMDGMIVKCGSQKYIIPLSSVIESINPKAEELKTLVTGKTVFYTNEKYIPLVMLGQLFNISDCKRTPLEGLIVIVETEQYGNVGIVVDDLIGQQQIVIKSLEDNYDPVQGIAAATILGTGKVSLILDVDGLSEMEHGSIQRKNYKKIDQNALISGGRN